MTRPLTTGQNYLYVLDKHILPVFGGYKMIAILRADIRAWVASLKDAGVKPATSKHCLAVLLAIFTTAFHDQITMLNPSAGIKAPTVPPATRRITPAQFAAIHAALPTEEMRLLVEIDVETGLRWGELVELRVHDLDLDHGLLAVSRTVIEIPAKFHPTGDRFLIKNYPKTNNPAASACPATSATSSPTTSPARTRPTWSSPHRHQSRNAASERTPPTRTR